jgi:hypothetical protein
MLKIHDLLPFFNIENWFCTNFLKMWQVEVGKDI